MFTVGLLYIVFIVLRYVPIPSFSEFFMKGFTLLLVEFVVSEVEDRKVNCTRYKKPVLDCL
jgi:cell shape-determining protein MreD